MDSFTGAGEALAPVLDILSLLRALPSGCMNPGSTVAMLCCCRICERLLRYRTSTEYVESQERLPGLSFAKVVNSKDATPLITLAERAAQA